MKKKIFLTLAIVMVLTCLFAIGASAARVEDYDDTFTLQSSRSIVHYEKWFYTSDSTKYVRKSYTDSVTVSFVDENGNAITEVAMWEYDAEDGKYYSLVWYISDWEFTWEDQTYTDNNVGTQTYPKYTAAKYTLSKVRAVDLRYYTYDSNRSNSSVPSWTEAKTLKCLEGIYLTNGTPDDTTDDIKLQDAVGIGRDSDNYGYVGYEAQFEATGNKIVVGNFRDCDFECDMEGNYGTANTWSRAENLQCLWYPDTMKHIVGGIGPVAEVDLGDGMEIIACQLVRDNKRITEVVLPNSLLYLNNESFRGTDLTKLTIGEGLIAHGSSPFLYTGTADITVVSKNIINSETANVLNFLGGKDSKQTVYTDGGLDDATKLKEALIASNASFDGRIVLYDYNTTQTRLDTDKYTVIFYNYNRCDAFYRGNHDIVSEAGNTCCGTCERCALFTMLPNPVHTPKDVLSFAGSETVDYYAEMSVLHVCEYCKNETADAEVYGAIFEKMGFSVSETDTTAIAFYVAVNHKAIAIYEEMAETTLVYGLIVSATPSANPITDVTDGQITLASSTVKIDMTGTSYTKFSVKITGIPENKTLNCAGYVVENDKVTYLNHATADSEAAVVSHAIALELQATTGGVEDNGDGEQVEVPVE